MFQLFSHSASDSPPLWVVGHRAVRIAKMRLDAMTSAGTLVHPDGPYWVKKDKGAWTLPKGEFEDGEEPLAAAQREFQEETGFVPCAPFLDLGSVQQKSGKVVLAWAFRGDCDPMQLVSNTCEVEWPPRSAKRIVIPEIDKGAWFTLSQAADFIREEQKSLLLRLEQQLRDALK